MIVPGDLFGVLPLWVPVFIIGAIGAGASTYGIYTRFITPVLLGRREDPRFDRPLQRLLGMVLVVFGQRRVLMSVSWRWRDLAGIGHFIIFWGFISKLVGYSLFLVLDPIDAGNSTFVLSPTGLKFFFTWLDILTVLVLASVAWAVVRRWIGRPKRLEGLQGYEPGLILMATASLMLLHQLTQISIVAAAEANPAAIAYLDGARTPEFAAATPIAGNIGAALGSAGFSGFGGEDPPRALLLGALPPHRELRRLHPVLQALSHHRLAAQRLLPEADAAGRAPPYSEHRGGRGLGGQASP